MKRSLALLAGTCLLALSSGVASAATCTAGSVNTYESAGFSCNVGPVIFSNINVVGTTDESIGGDSAVIFGPTAFRVVEFDYDPDGAGPRAAHTQYGLSLNFLGDTGEGGGRFDVAWSYNVSAAPGFKLTDVYLGVAASGVGSFTPITTTEVLSNGVTLEVTRSGNAFAEFDPVQSLFAFKDLAAFAGATSFTSASILINAFSVTPAKVPGPIAGAGLPALMALGGFVWARRRKAAATALPA